MSRQDILLHTCCAPCAGGCVERLLEENRRVILYYSNDNMCDIGEFNRRLESVKLLAEHYGVALEVDEYRNDLWMCDIRGLEDEPERGKRCEKCFLHSLRKSAEFAGKINTPFTTSLTVSPYKSSKMIFSIGRELGNFAEYDFKKQNGYLKSTRIAAELGFYRQKFCGCRMSALQLEQKEKQKDGSTQK